MQTSTSNLHTKKGSANSKSYLDIQISYYNSVLMGYYNSRRLMYKEFDGISFVRGDESLYYFYMEYNCLLICGPYDYVICPLLQV